MKRKDIIIKRRTVTLALWILLGCYLIVNIINIIAIASYSTSWVEIFTMQGYVIVFSIVLFLLAGFVWAIIKMLTPKKNKHFSRR